ncbi:MAG: bifunctional homocysteine S-methyltransferase/methylenetetrahydrofolate reductase [Oscillospiraceae bacterium]|nr:bifunctional homocysteine S-methyltransferase/methylenetetrahydrofolate reductase [Oscillospiraceae bacterium]
MAFFEKTPILFDGAMGTYFPEKQPLCSCTCEEANLLYPETVEQIHREYIEAGAEAIKTNTFGANRLSLLGRSCDFRQVIAAGVEIANRAAAGTDVAVFADIGPIAGTGGEENPTAGLEEYTAVIDQFLSLGCENFLLETFSDPELPIAAAKYIRACAKGSTIILSFAVAPDGFSRTGKSAEYLLRRVAEENCCDGCGFNCVSGPAHMLDMVSRLSDLPEQLSVMPNAGYPTVRDGRTHYLATPAYFAQAVSKMAGKGASVLGGCCGTTPAHIRALSELLKEQAPSADQRISQKEETVPARKPSRSKFIRKLEEGKKVIAVELDSPAGTDMQFFTAAANEIVRVGADIITVADCPIARARMDSSMVAALYRTRYGIDMMPHLTCRDRNINATKALLFGLSYAGIENVLTVTGDPIPTCERDEVKGVYNFHSAMLARYIADLNETEFRERPFRISAALGINAVNFEAELRRAVKKEAAGASVFFTQPIYTPQAIQRLKMASEVLSSPILCGLMPLVSYRNASFSANEIAGIEIPPETVESFRDLSKEEAAAHGIRLALETADAAREFCAGYYLVTPLKRKDVVCSLLRKLRQQEGIQ